MVDSVTYPPNQSSYTGEVGRAIGKKADVIVNVGYTPELAAMMKDARNAPDKGTWLSVGWSVNQELFDAVGTAAAEGLYTVDAAPNVDGAAYANLRRAFQAKTGKELLASNTFAFYAYDSAIVVALAMAACECTKGAALTKAIAKVSTAPGKKVGGYAEGIAALKGGGDIDYQGPPATWSSTARATSAPATGSTRSGTARSSWSRSSPCPEGRFPCSKQWSTA